MEKFNKTLNITIIISIILIPILLVISFYFALAGKNYVKVNEDNKTEIQNMLKENDIEISKEISRIGYQQGLGDWEFYIIYDNLESEEIVFDDGDARDLYDYTKNYGKNLASYLANIIEILIKCIFICVILKIVCKIYKKTKSKKVWYVFLTIVVVLMTFSILNNIRKRDVIKELFEESAWVKVHLKLGTSQDEIDSLTKEIEKMVYFRTIDFVPKEEIFSGYGDIDLLQDGIRMECYYIEDSNGKFDEFAYFRNIEKEMKKYECVESVTYGSLLDLYRAGGMKSVNEYKEKVKRIEEREKEENNYNTIEESQDKLGNTTENDRIYADHYDLTVFSEYYGKNISYKKTVELLNKFCNEYYIYLTNSESKTGDNPGIYVYLSRNSSTDKALKDSIVSSIESMIKVFEDSVEATYNISYSYGTDPKYGEYIFIERNNLKMLRADFKITSKTDDSKDNYDYIEGFMVILESQEFIDKINNNYNIDITNNVKIWSMTKNNFLMNIGCEGINKEQYNEYSEYVFKTFKDFIKSKYNLDLETTTTFNEVVQ